MTERDHDWRNWDWIDLNSEQRVILSDEYRHWQRGGDEARKAFEEMWDRDDEAE